MVDAVQEAIQYTHRINAAQPEYRGRPKKAQYRNRRTPRSFYEYR